MAMPHSSPLDPAVFDRLHPTVISNPGDIRSLLMRFMKAAAVLRRGTNRAIEREEAWVERIEGDLVFLRCRNFGTLDEVILLSGELEGLPYFFSARVLVREATGPDEQAVRVALPALVYRAERRDRVRKAPGRWRQLRLAPLSSHARPFDAEVLDESGGGVRVRMPVGDPPRLGERYAVASERHEDDGVLAEVRNLGEAEPETGWRRVGLSLLPASPAQALPAEALNRALAPSLVLPSGFSRLAVPPEPEVVAFRDAAGHTLVGLLDRTDTAGDAPHPAVLIPSAWGKTKETSLALARQIVAAFEAEGADVQVLRFDGVRKRGESTNDPECASPESSNLHYTFSQGARDLEAAARYMRDAQLASRVYVVSFSVASVEARRALAEAPTGLFDGWVSLVGATDPQSLIRVISGGVDYLGGAEAGVRFGQQDVQGLLLDIDRTASDALSNELAFLEDARRDFSKIHVPITWVAGENDAWMDPRRVTDVLSFGPSINRRLVFAPCGHQLRSSEEAGRVFGFAASEIFRFFMGRPPAVRPEIDSKSLRVRQINERRRLKRAEASAPEVLDFWRDYLIGRGETLGMELVAATGAFRALMHEQITQLELGEGEVVLDLGSGVGSFFKTFAGSGAAAPGIRILELDFVREALRRSRRVSPGSSPAHRSWLHADLAVGSAISSLPLRDGAADKVLLSLVLNYLPDPEALLAETARVLRPGGRLVLSALKPDADTSRICVEGVLELRDGLALSSFGERGEQLAMEALGGFINDAGRLLDLEERGVFEFWPRDVLEKAVAKAGFDLVRVVPVFGAPPQAWLIVAERRA
jgi:ubiquinone/menaquinone biosynthesis C-methylase UbiE/pimeloyl-ACP methyl ester carboxylesterase